ncbi:hypothetical protein [Jatrophihabitans sp.]|uniref:hypothetical protein n=1 Tax=Jatrophihabitans sp. TaxID=1932789 RepID=UPI002BE96E5A|nr:hypothetical protein [Jatrophihabitans sp.]
MSIATDIRAYADLALEQGRAALNQAGTAAGTANKRLAADAGKQVRVVLGAADLLAETVGKQVEALGKQAEHLGRRMESLPELSAAAAGNLAKAQESGKALLDRAQDDALARLGELRERLDAGLETVRSLPSLPVIAAGTTSGYLDTARQAYGRLTARGGARLADLRNDPRVGKLLGELDAASAALATRIAPVLGAVRSEVVSDLDSAAEKIENIDLGENAAAPATRKAAETKASPAKASTPAKSGSTKSGTTRRTAAKKD